MAIGIIHKGHISDAVVRRMKARADAGVFDGLSMSPYFLRCLHYCENTQAMLIFTRDVGMHSSGWWKNPDYERCYHLSISFEVAGVPLPQNHKDARRWCEAFFGGDTKLLWIEPPYSLEGKQREVYHYRLFCDEGWQPIKPRGEVYSREWTPADWKSWSDIHGDEIRALGKESGS